MNSFLLTAFIYLTAAVVAVPVAKRFGLGSVLGYLLAGVIIGPNVLALVGNQGGGVQSVAEFGVVMMLFIIGLELRPTLLWQLRVQLLGLGGLQFILTSAAITGCGIAAGYEWKTSLAVGMTLALSSTAIVLQTLNEKQLIKTSAGQSIFSVLLFQDIAVIPILAILPLLALAAPTMVVESGHHESLIDHLPGWAQAVSVLGVVGLIVLAGRYALSPLLRLIATTHLRELFTATALLLVVGVALLMETVGISPALGAFLAGVLLANSEYRHELEADIEPFKGLLLGLFFITVGAGIDFVYLREHTSLIFGLLLGLVLLKFALLYFLSRIFKLNTSDGLLFSLALAQSGEFAFVLFSFSLSHGILTSEQTAPLVATVALSMAITPLLFLLHEHVAKPYLSRKTRPAEREADEMPNTNHRVIIAGFGRFGHVVGRLLYANKIETVVLDHDSDQVDVLRKLGMKVYYGDALRLQLLHAAGAKRCRLFIITLADRAKSIALVKLIKTHFPGLKILARAVDRPHAYDLLEEGVEHVYRETLGSSLELGAEALHQLGLPANQARRQAQIFRKHEEASLVEFAKMEADHPEYFSRAREHISHLDSILRADLEQLPHNDDTGWEAPPSDDDSRD